MQSGRCASPNLLKKIDFGGKGFESFSTSDSRRIRGPTTYSLRSPSPLSKLIMPIVVPIVKLLPEPVVSSSEQLSRPGACPSLKDRWRNMAFFKKFGVS